MRLSLVLTKFPRNLPNGNVLIGKYRLVKRVTEKDIFDLKRDIEREKTNAMLCLHPAVSREEDEEIRNKLQEGLMRPDKLWFRMRKAKIEATKMAPVPLSEHFNRMRRMEKW